jgi:hypothetical protein
MVVFERESSIRDELLVLWASLIMKSGLTILASVVSSWLVHWLELASFPSGMAADDCALVKYLLDLSLLKKVHTNIYSIFVSYAIFGNLLD